MNSGVWLSGVPTGRGSTPGFNSRQWTGGLFSCVRA